MKMILFQNDYVVIDVDKTIYSWPDIQQESEFRELIFSITVQCNGKLKRTRFCVPVKRAEKWVDGSNIVNWFYVSDFNYIYNPFQMLHDLGYDIPHSVDLHPLINKALETHFA